ncbi:MAG TPA: Dabb family protein [Candidatus Nanopelagicales bacterium]
MITHVACFTLSDRGDRDEADRRLRALSPQIEQILSLQTGLDAVGDAAAADLVLITTHVDVAGLKAYQQHPVHQELLGWLRPRLAARTVVDFES